MKKLLLPALALLVSVSACKKDDSTPAPTTMQVTGTLSGANEVPAVSTQATGSMSGTYDTSTNLLVYTVTFSGLSGPATMAHFHYGDAKHKGNVAIPLTVASATSGTITGKIPLVMTSASGSTPAASQPDSLLKGHMYVNIHTNNNPGGELRANLTAK